jgi:hypothetical protein
MLPAAAVETRPPARRAMMVPWLDAAAVGGLSLVLLPLLLLLMARPIRASTSGLVLLGVLFNWPHFIASYRLLYATGESVRRHRAASIYVPAALAGYALFAVTVWQSHPLYANLLAVAAGVYLARHYTGQAWGMMASFAHVDGISFTAPERRLFRSGLNVLMVWHAIWALRQSMGLVAPSLVAPVTRLYDWTIWLPGLALMVGLAGMFRFLRRTGHAPPGRVLIPWAAIHVWYLAMAIEPGALFVVQIAHGLQYLMFPLRVEMNRAQVAKGREWKKSALLLGVWILVGLAVFEGLEPLFRLGFGAAGGQGPLPVVVSSVILAAVAVHHYFIDGALYKLRNPEVRRDLFAHLPRV